MEDRHRSLAWIGPARGVNPSDSGVERADLLGVAGWHSLMQVWNEPPIFWASQDGTLDRTLPHVYLNKRGEETERGAACSQCKA